MTQVWFFAAAREGVTQQYAEGVYYNKLTQPASLLYEPDLSRPAFTDDYSKDISVRFTWQAAARHKIVLANSIQPNCNCVFNLLNPGVRRTPEAGGPHHYNPNYIPTASWTYPATSRMMFEAGFSAQIVNQHDKREPGFPETNIGITDQGLNLFYGNIPTRTLPRRQYQERSSLLRHRFPQLQDGLTMRTVTIGRYRQSRQRPLDAQRFEDLPVQNGVPNQVTITDAPWNFEESVRDVAIYAQDQWTIRNMTMTSASAQRRVGADPRPGPGAGFFVPERRFAPVDDVPHYQNLSPRLGAAYDLFGTGRTAIKASLGHSPTASSRPPPTPSPI